MLRPIWDEPNVQGPSSLRIAAAILAFLLIFCEVISRSNAQAFGEPQTATQCLAGSENPATPNENTARDMRKGLKSLRSEASALHSVILCWKPSVPAGHSGGNSIIGYIVYRSTVPNDPKPMPINSIQITGTTFIDRHVEPGKVYYYVTRAVNASGTLSPPSNEARAKIPR